MPQLRRGKRRLPPSQSTADNASDVEQLLEDAEQVSKNKDIDLNAETFNQDYNVRLVGGHRLTAVRPLYTEDEHLIFPHEHELFLMSTATRTITKKITPCANMSEDHIRAICLHPFLPYFQVFAFTQNGNVYQCAYTDGTVISKCHLSIQSGQLTWGAARAYKNGDRTQVILFYAVQVEYAGKPRYEIYSCPLNEPTEAIKLHSMRAFSEQRIAFGVDNQYLLMLERNKCLFLPLNKGKLTDEIQEPIVIFSQKTKGAARHLVSIVASPTEHLMAHAEADGRIYLRFLNPSDPEKIGKCAKTSLHWHSSMPADLAFSKTGIYLYSVGHEGVVVRWTVATQEKNFAARLGYGLRYVTPNHNDSQLAITLQNNLIRLITSHFAELQGELSTLMYYEHQVFSSGLVYNTKMNALALNARPGHLQFVNPLGRNALRTLDVTRTNYIEPLTQKMCNIDVHRLASSNCGNWLATFEMRDDQITAPELRLKLWRWSGGRSADPQRAPFELHTCIHLPHRAPIQNMRFSPNGTILITLGEDNLFKAWTLDPEVNSWLCSFTSPLSANQAPPSLITFAADSTICGIVYGPLLSLWKCANFAQNMSFLDSINSTSGDFIHAEFGTGETSHLLSTCTHNELLVWELPRLRPLWSWKPEQPETQILHCTYSRECNRLLALTNQDELNVFALGACASAQPLKRIPLRRLLANDVASITCFPNIQSDDTLFGRAVPCLLTHSKQLYSLERVGACETVADEEYQLRKNSEETANKFSFVEQLLKRREAPETGDDTRQKLATYALYSNPAKLVNEMFSNVPSHVLPPMDKIGRPFLQALHAMAAASQKTPSTMSIGDKQVDNQIESTDVEMNDLTLNTPETNKENGIILTTHTENIKPKEFLFEEDYSFMRKYTK